AGQEAGMSTHTVRDVMTAIRVSRPPASAMRAVRKRIAPAATAMIVALVGLAPPGHAADRRAQAPYDTTVLSEIAEDVLRHASMDARRAAPAGVDPNTPLTAEEFEGVDVEVSPDSPVAHIAPAREGIAVLTPPGAAVARKAKPETPGAGYQSNT